MPPVKSRRRSVRGFRQQPKGNPSARTQELSARSVRGLAQPHTFPTLPCPRRPHTARRDQLRRRQNDASGENGSYGIYATEGSHEAHPGDAEDDLERSGDEAEEDAEVGEERGPRRGSTARARITAPSSDLQVGGDEQHEQKRAYEELVNGEARRRRIPPILPTDEAEQGSLGMHMAAAAREVADGNGV